jgi:MFS family permease
MVTLALGPLVWMPIADCYGRRPIWIVSVLGAGLFNIACAKSSTYGAMVVFRIFSVSFSQHEMRTLSA